MKNLLKLLVARRLSATPIGMIALGVGWLIARRRKQRQAEPETSRTRRRMPAHR
ncbi:DUF6203 family protein [Nonomuraea aridisoli]|uniref:DUF6203 family protein n=1 Tax=Nonomuraea aridisoli TaxID=2070368 RepID=UPI0011B943C4|nr:DUF6203 family protein [Nonomuraea aridisoli]